MSQFLQLLKKESSQWEILILLRQCLRWMWVNKNFSVRKCTPTMLGRDLRKWSGSRLRERQHENKQMTIKVWLISQKTTQGSSGIKLGWCLGNLNKGHKSRLKLELYRMANLSPIMKVSGFLKITWRSRGKSSRSTNQSCQTLGMRAGLNLRI